MKKSFVDVKTDSKLARLQAKILIFLQLS